MVQSPFSPYIHSLLLLTMAGKWGRRKDLACVEGEKKTPTGERKRGEKMIDSAYWS